MTQIKGIDVSKWQGEIDWKKVKADGVGFVFIRTGYSSNYTDPFFEKNYSGAKSAGVKVGAYHYSYALSVADAKKESDFMLTLLKNKQFDYPVVLDVEDDSQIKLGKKIITDIIIAFCDNISSAGHTPMLYINTNWRNNYVDMTRISNLLLWQAHYTSVKPTAIDGRVAVWQYSNTGKVNGINGSVDMNCGYADLTKSAAVNAAVSVSSGKIINHVISTNNEILSASGNAFRTPERPTHDGIDLVDKDRKEKTQDVYITAVADGTVTDIIVGSSIGYSTSVLHENKILSRYFHMKAGSVRVKAGQKIKKGDIIGTMGTTGDSTGIHLHFGVKENSASWDTGTYVDPMPYLTGVKTIKSQNTQNSENSENSVNTEKNEVELMSKEYDELKKEIDGLKTNMDKWTTNSRIKYGWVDGNMPEWARSTVTKLTKKGYLTGNETGNLQLSDDMLRIFVVLDRAETFGK